MAIENRALQAKERKEVTSSAEQTRRGPIFTPLVDIFENARELTLLADMPGVKATGLSIDLNENVLTISAEVDAQELGNETCIMREYRTGKYFRQFALPEMVDQGKIGAELREGVLKLTLPKAEAAKPRKIAVRAD